MFLKPIRDLPYPDFGNRVPCLHAFALHLIRSHQLRLMACLSLLDMLWLLTDRK